MVATEQKSKRMNTENTVQLGSDPERQEKARGDDGIVITVDR